MKGSDSQSQRERAESLDGEQNFEMMDKSMITRTEDDILTTTDKTSKETSPNDNNVVQTVAATVELNNHDREVLQPNGELLDASAEEIESNLLCHPQEVQSL